MLKAVSSSIEASFEELLKREKSVLQTERNFFEQANAPERKYAIYLTAKSTLESIALYESLIEQDRAYNEKVKHLKGQSATQLWNIKAKELKEKYEAKEE